MKLPVKNAFVLAAVLSLASTASAAVHVMMQEAHGVTTAIAALEAKVKAYTADRVLSAAEKAALDKLAAAIWSKAQRLVTAQGAPAIAGIEHFRALLAQNRVATNGASVIAALTKARGAVWTQAKSDKEKSPFATFGAAWKKPYTGVRTLATSNRGAAAHVLAFDLANPKIAVLMSRYQRSGANYVPRVVLASAQSNQAQYAINGDFFSLRTFKPSGYTMSRKVFWAGTDTNRWEPGFAFTGHHVVFLPKGKAVPPWVENVISARPRIMENGAVITSYNEPDKAARSRRTGMGISKTGRVLYLVAAASATAVELGTLLKKVGAHEAMTMDAGGSAQMVSGGRVVQPSSDGGGVRRVANVLMVRFK